MLLRIKKSKITRLRGAGVAARFGHQEEAFVASRETGNTATDKLVTDRSAVYFVAELNLFANKVTCQLNEMAAENKITIFAMTFHRCSHTQPPPQDPSSLIITSAVLYHKT